MRSFVCWPSANVNRMLHTFVLNVNVEYIYIFCDMGSRSVNCCYFCIVDAVFGCYLRVYGTTTQRALFYGLCAPMRKSKIHSTQFRSIWYLDLFCGTSVCCITAIGISMTDRSHMLIIGAMDHSCLCPSYLHTRTHIDSWFRARSRWTMM